MILVHVICDEEQMSTDIAELLVSERLVVDAVLVPGTKITRGETASQTVSKQQFMVYGKTKALLFDTIDKLLREKYGERLPTLYSLPIVHMDWDQSSELLEKTIKV